MAIAQQQKPADTTNANASDFRAAMSAASARDHDRFEAHLRDDVTFINPMVGTVDKAGFRAFHTALWAGLPDINYKVERTVSEGDTVVGECTVTGTHRGELAGVPATNKSVTVPVIFVADYENGKVKRWSSYLDTATLLRQIGAMK
ncbi:MAG: ester cyclase [Chloroflexi bacterium]|nr:MAG: ester cyclase [Chloroflexota bacterium]